jgi:hypothetical protein
VGNQPKEKAKMPIVFPTEEQREKFDQIIDFIKKITGEEPNFDAICVDSDNCLATFICNISQTVCVEKDER